jgi:hypothetical protein
MTRSSAATRARAAKRKIVFITSLAASAYGLPPTKKYFGGGVSVVTTERLGKRVTAAMRRAAEWRCPLVLFARHCGPDVHNSGKPSIWFGEDGDECAAFELADVFVRAARCGVAELHVHSCGSMRKDVFSETIRLLNEGYVWVGSEYLRHCGSITIKGFNKTITVYNNAADGSPMKVVTNFDKYVMHGLTDAAAGTFCPRSVVKSRVSFTAAGVFMAGKLRTLGGAPAQAERKPPSGTQAVALGKRTAPKAKKRMSRSRKAKRK